MKLCRFTATDQAAAPAIIADDAVIPISTGPEGFATLAALLETPDLSQLVSQLATDQPPVPLGDVQLLAPIDQQEVWAAGVTYKRSQTARMEESEAAASCYDRVYQSPRPELFFKATPHRVVGPGGAIRIRQDASWNVPEPEITLVLNSRLELVGFTAGNDVSSRDIEGDNPLYLPQAKLYDGCCALGPSITLLNDMPPLGDISVELEIVRGDQVVFAGRSGSQHMARTFDELIAWLGRDNTFPHGVFLLTGTGIVPDNDFTMHPGDRIAITVAGVGTLVNHVVQGPASYPSRK